MNCNTVIYYSVLAIVCVAVVNADVQSDVQAQIDAAKTKINQNLADAAARAQNPPPGTIVVSSSCTGDGVCKNTSTGGTGTGAPVVAVVNNPPIKSATGAPGSGAANCFALSSAAFTLVSAGIVRFFL